MLSFKKKSEQIVKIINNSKATSKGEDRELQQVGTLSVSRWYTQCAAQKWLGKEKKEGKERGREGGS